MFTLKELCLNLIVREFEKFYFAFTVSKDETLQRNFNFLQRKYSFKLAAELFKKEKMKEEYIEFLINEHLQFLDGDWFENSCHLTSIRDIICRLPKLKVVYLSNHCCDEILERISKFCHKVTEIDMTYSPVTDSGIKYICKDVNGIIPCPKLKNLFIEGSRVTDEGVKYLLQNLPSLEMLHSPEVPRILYSLHERELPKLENVRSYNLVSLNLLKINDLSYYTDLLQVCLNVCPGLKSIACSISDKEQFNLFNNVKLEKMHIKFVKTDPQININSFLKVSGCNLASLKFYNCIMSVSDLAVSCPKLKQLYVSSVSFLEEDNDLQPIFPCLIQCTFQNIKDQKSTVKATTFLLLSSPKLECVSFKHCVLSLDIKTHILKCCENQIVKQLTFEGPILEIDFVRDILLSGPSLVTLNLLRCDLSDQDEKELYEFVKILPNKPRICFDRFDISDDDSEEESDNSLDSSEESSEIEDAE